MAKLSDNTLLQRAIGYAIHDRISLSDAYPQNSAHWVAAREKAQAIKSLKGKHIDRLTEEQHWTAFEAFLHAEQWVESLAESNPGPEPEKEARQNLRLFREVRLRRWGKTELEAMLETAVAVDVRTLLESKGAVTGNEK